MYKRILCLHRAVGKQIYMQEKQYTSVYDRPREHKNEPNGFVCTMVVKHIVRRRFTKSLKRKTIPYSMCKPRRFAERPGKWKNVLAQFQTRVSPREGVQKT